MYAIQTNPYAGLEGCGYNPGMSAVAMTRPGVISVTPRPRIQDPQLIAAMDAAAAVGDVAAMQAIGNQMAPTRPGTKAAALIKRGAPIGPLPRTVRPEAIVMPDGSILPATNGQKFQLPEGVMDFIQNIPLPQIQAGMDRRTRNLVIGGIAALVVGGVLIATIARR